MHSIIPFQLSYAVSIHKAQGLVDNSVKIIILSNNTERITCAENHQKINYSAKALRTVISRIAAEEQHTRSLEIIWAKLFDS